MPMRGAVAFETARRDAVLEKLRRRPQPPWASLSKDSHAKSVAVRADQGSVCTLTKGRVDRDDKNPTNRPTWGTCRHYYLKDGAATRYVACTNQFTTTLCSSRRSDFGSGAYWRKLWKVTLDEMDNLQVSFYYMLLEFERRNWIVSGISNFLLSLSNTLQNYMRIT